MAENGLEASIWLTGFTQRQEMAARRSSQGSAAVNECFIKAVSSLTIADERHDRDLRLFLTCRSFAMAVVDNQQRKRKCIPEDENTTVHIWLHV
ncbi:hypothetical protein DFS34DRAFT_655179 [Phlyctochytrium arcticum]|nr:hypothetical protein DFS34DRAFT_655179 [Phlyctochytrium arcticum]